MPVRLRPLVLLTLVASLGACASGSAGAPVGQPAAPADAPADAPARSTQPRIIDGGSGSLRIQTTRVVAAGQATTPEPPDIMLSVDVDTTGRAMLGTLSVTGRDAAENSATLREWISGARFAPATRGGVPVVGTFRWRAGR